MTEFVRLGCVMIMRDLKVVCLASLLLYMSMTAAYAVDLEKYPLGINLNGIADWSPEMPFLDLMKQARPWIPQRRNRPWGKGGMLILDEHGWVRTLEPRQWADLIFLTVKQPLPFTEFVVRYDGKGKIDYAGIARRIRRIRTGEDIVRVSQKINGHAILRLLKTNPEDPVRNIRIIPIKYLSEYEKGEVFNPLWLKYVQRFRAIRFMDWMGTNGSDQDAWSRRPRPDDYTWQWRGVPLEILVSLANRIHADPWFNMPHKANDDYIRNMALLVRTNLNKESTIYVEHSNEVWNWRFKQAHYAKEQAKSRWGREGNHWMQWHGMRTATLCQIWKKIFSGEDSRIQCVLGIHPGWRGLEKAALECPSWDKEGNGPCYRNGIDAIAITGYFTGCLDGNAGWKRPARYETIRKWFAEPDGGMKKAFEQALDGRHFGCERTLKGVADTISYFAAIAKSYGMSLLAYEGGQHVTGNGSKIQDDPAFIHFHLQFNRSEYMYTLTRKILELWKENGGGLFMYYNDIYPASKWGSWGAMDNLQDTGSPKIRAIRDFSKGRECWWDGC